MKKLLFFFLIAYFFLLSSANNLNAQTYYFDKYGVREGLGQSKVYDVLQDLNGFVWMGTAAGVSKFNGLQFVNYTSENGLAANGVKTIFYDSLHRLWFGHIGGGISMFDGQKFVRIKIGDIKKDVSKILEDDEHNIWISTEENGVFKITNPYDKSGKYNVIRYSGNLSDRVFGMTYSSQFGMLFITDIGVKYFDKKSKTFEFITKVYPKWPQYFNTICLYEDSKRNLWVGTYNGGLYKFSNKLSEPKIYDIRDGLVWNWISCIRESQDGSIWVGTWGGGISKINTNGIQNFTLSNGLNDLEIRCITEDLEGNIIIGTNNSGLSLFKGFSFVQYQNLDEKPVQVFGITKRNTDKFYVATNKGIKAFEISNTNLLSGVKTYNRTNSNALMSDDVRFLIPDSKNTIWVGSWNAGGVSSIDSKTGIINYNPVLNGPIFDWGRGNVTAMTITQKDELFVGTNDALIYFEINSNKGSILKQTDGLASSDISALYTDSKNVTWVGSRGKGISKIEGSSIKIVNPDFLFTPTCFKENKSGQLWVGTEGAGIFLLEGNKIVKKLSISDGLLSNLITAIELDNDGNVYIGTNKGLNFLSLNEHRLLAFTEKDGFVGLEVKPNSMFKDEKGNIWIGSAAGLTLCNPDLIKINKRPPLVHISRLRVNLLDIPIEQNINLKYNQNSILIDFQGICISDAEKVKYQIKLKGADKEIGRAHV